MPYASSEVSIKKMCNFSKAILHCFSDSSTLIVFLIVIYSDRTDPRIIFILSELRNMQVTDISQRIVFFWLQYCLNSVWKYSNACWAASGHMWVSLCFSVILKSALQLLMAVEHLLLKHQLGGRDAWTVLEFQGKGSKMSCLLRRWKLHEMHVSIENRPLPLGSVVLLQNG